MHMNKKRIWRLGKKYIQEGKHSKIDIEKAAITGWSLGGGVTLFSGWKPIMDAIDSDYKFAAHLAFYPPCFSEPKTIKFTG